MPLIRNGKKITRRLLVAVFEMTPDTVKPGLRRLYGKFRRFSDSAASSSAVYTLADKPVALANWTELVGKSSRDVFVQPDPADFDACMAIRLAYRPVLERYGIPYDELFGGSIKDGDAAALHALIRTRKPELAFQVGTFVGYSAMVIAHALKVSGAGRLIACDPELPHRTSINPVDIAREISSVLGLCERVDFVRGWFSLPIAEDFDEALLRDIPVTGRRVLEEAGSRVDLAFIDGDHSLTATVCDLALIQEFLSVGGVAVFHDVKSWPSVALALRGFWEDIYFYRSGTPAFFTLDTWDGPDGLAALRRDRRAERSMLRVRVLDADSGLPVPAAKVRLVENLREGYCGVDGVIYFWGEYSADCTFEVTSAGYKGCRDALGISTNGRLAERTVHIGKAV